MSTPAPLSWHGWPVCDANTSSGFMRPQSNVRPLPTWREDPRRTCNTAGAGIKAASELEAAKTRLRPSGRQIPHVHMKGRSPIRRCGRSLKRPGVTTTPGRPLT